MFKRILVPLDESELAEQALPIASRVARVAKSTIELLEVVPPSNRVWAVLGRAADASATSH